MICTVGTDHMELSAFWLLQTCLSSSPCLWQNIFFFLWSQKVKKLKELARSWSRQLIYACMSIDICIPFDIPTVLHYAAPGAQERSIIWQHYPPDMAALILCSWVIAKAIKWLAISSMLVSHQISLFPSSKIRMSSMCHCIETMSWQIKLLITLLPFLNIDTWAVSFKSKGGSILAS